MDISLRKKGKYIVDTASSDRTSSLIQNDISSCQTKYVPKQVCNDIDRIIANENNHEIYGSLGFKSHSYGARTPADLDVVVSNPIDTAYQIQKIIQRKGIASKVESCHAHNSYNVQVLKNGKMVKAVDIHPIDTHKTQFPALYGSSKDSQPERIGRFNVQNLQDQMRRKANYVFTHKDTSRLLKDESDLVNILQLRLEEKKLQAESELARIRKSKKYLDQIKRHVRTHNEWNAREYPLNKDPITDAKEKQFKRFAVQNPSMDVRKIYISNNKVKTLQNKKKKPIGLFDINNSAWNYWKQ